jgi:RNA 2',3'-cyclic 3'-phosphodiesterase
MKRTFFAVDVLPDIIIKDLIAEAKGFLSGEKIKWVDTDSLHLTLKFLGDTPEEVIQPIVKKLQQQLKNIQVMQLDLSSLGLFKNLHDPRVLWMGIKPNPALEKAAHILDESMLSFGFQGEGKEFRPHLTLGRIKEIKKTNRLGNLIERYRNVSFGKAKISEIIFYESLLRSEGPVYIPLSKFQLG